MILLVHGNAQQAIKVLHNNEEVRFNDQNICTLLWNLAEEHPEETLVWVERTFETDVDLTVIPQILHHNLIMASYAIKTKFLPEAIGYIDQMPFVRLRRDVMYGTWQMSSDVGLIKAHTLLKFKTILRNIKDFRFLLNSVAKLGQQNGLFCYSTPSLWKAKKEPPTKIIANANTEEVFQFVFGHYKNIRLLLLFCLYCKYENSFPLKPLLRSLTGTKYFQKQIDLSEITVNSKKGFRKEATIDVIIPTMGRRDYLLQVMEDLKNQKILPKKVVVVEQNPIEDSTTELPELKSVSWPFEVKHHFIHRTGACNARNMALEEVDADWIFFADDDNRMENDLLEKTLREIRKYGTDLLTLNYRQKGEPLIFNRVKQWGTFGAGNSLVSRKFAKTIRFDPAFEYGYGEDVDYGMQLRAAGCDIIYHPQIEIRHLKAPRGGFREVHLQPWEDQKPKPSPTLMLLAKKYYSEEQLRGFKAELLLRYYPKQEIRNPFKYFHEMRRRWEISETWAKKISILDKEVKEFSS